MILTLLITAGLSVSSTQGSRFISCQDTTTLKCADGKILHIDRVTFGRQQVNVPGCNYADASANANTACKMDVTAPARALCQGHPHCMFSNLRGTLDPCRGTYKYYNGTFTCKPQIPATGVYRVGQEAKARGGAAVGLAGWLIIPELSLPIHAPSVLLGWSAFLHTLATPVRFQIWRPQDPSDMQETTFTLLSDSGPYEADRYDVNTRASFYLDPAVYVSVQSTDVIGFQHLTETGGISTDILPNYVCVNDPHKQMRVAMGMKTHPAVGDTLELPIHPGDNCRLFSVEAILAYGVLPPSISVGSTLETKFSAIPVNPALPPDDAIAEYTTRHTLHCARLCAHCDLCLMFEYNEVTQRCFLRHASEVITSLQEANVFKKASFPSKSRIGSMC